MNVENYHIPHTIGAPFSAPGPQKQKSLYYHRLVAIPEKCEPVHITACRPAHRVAQKKLAHGVYGNNFVYSRSLIFHNFWHMYTIGNLQLDGA